MSLPALPLVGSVQPLTHGIKPHDGARGFKGQLTWILSALLHQLVVIAVGRQVGKTTCVQFLLLEEASRHKGFYTAAYVAQGHPQASEFYELCLANWTKAGIVARYRDKGQDRFIELIAFGANSGCKIYFFSGDPEAHRGAAGKTLNRLIVDEASLIPEEALTSTFRPMLNVTRGKTLILGSPYPSGIGFDWFQRAWEHRDRDGRMLPTPPGAFESFNAPSECNPFSSAEWIAEQRRSCRTRTEEACQYDAIFIKDMGVVFENLDAVFCLPYIQRGLRYIGAEYIIGEHYVAGLDYGKFDDWTVLSIFHANSRKQVALLRIQGQYEYQLGEITSLIESYGKPVIYADGREGGTVLNEMMRKRYGKSLYEVKWSRGGQWDKESNIFRGQDLCQQTGKVAAGSAGWRLLAVPDQKEEFRLYASEQISPTNPSRRYGAPPGRHDDFVAAALYATYGMPVETYDFSNTNRSERAVVPWSEEWLRAVRKSQRSFPTRNPFRL